MAFNPELCRNESEVESKLIVQYLLPELGYTPDTWHQEVAVGSIRLDFLALQVKVVGNIEMPDPRSVLDFKPNSTSAQELELLAI